MLEEWLMYTRDEVLIEALQKVMQQFIASGYRPAEQTALDAWNTLSTIATAHPDWRVGRYYWYSGHLEQQQFMESWEAWRQSVNGV
jgi:hypothetical protein